MKDKHGMPQVPCKWCKTPTSMTGTRMCDRCWELEHRIQGDLALAKHMIKELEKKK